MDSSTASNPHGTFHELIPADTSVVGLPRVNTDHGNMEALVLHETVKRLMHEVTKLKDECHKLKSLVAGACRNDYEQNGAIIGDHNTTTEHVPGGDVISPPTKICAVQKGNRELHYQATATQVPEHHGASLNSVERTQHDVRKAMHVPGIPDDISELGSYKHGRDADRREAALQSAQNDFFTDQLKQLNARVTSNTHKMDKLEAGLTALSTEIKDHKEPAASYDARSMNELASLKRFEFKQSSIQRQQQAIDDVATNRDLLLLYFRQLSKMIVTHDQPWKHEGGFEGDFDDLFSLRARVTRRLAIHTQLVTESHAAQREADL